MFTASLIRTLVPRECGLTVAVAVAVVATVVGSFGPGATAYDWNYGMEGAERDLLVVLVCGVGAGGAAWAGLARKSRGWLIMGAVAFGIVALGANVDIGDVQSVDLRFIAPVSVGFGLWAVLAGGVVGCVACIVAAARNKPACPLPT